MSQRNPRKPGLHVQEKESASVLHLAVPFCEHSLSSQLRQSAEENELPARTYWYMYLDVRVSPVSPFPTKLLMFCFSVCSGWEPSCLSTWVDGWVSERECEWMDVKTVDSETDELIDEWMDAYTDEWVLN